jgi:hypothetical protein
MEYKTIFVPSPIKPSRRGFKHYSNVIDGEILSNDTQATITMMSEKGFHLFSTTPITSTQYYGQVYTEGLILTFCKETTESDQHQD